MAKDGDIIDSMLGWIFELIGWLFNLFIKFIFFIFGILFKLVGQGIKTLLNKKAPTQET